MYLNGVHIYRNDSPLAPTDISTVYIPRDLLRHGDNVLAVYVSSQNAPNFVDFGLYGEDLPWITVELAAPGTLGQEVLYQANMLSDVQFLRVKGAMNADDWTTIANMANLRGADLSQATATEVPAGQFRNRTDFALIQLPQGLKTIGEYAFHNSRIGGISVPATVTYVGRNAFSGNPLLTTVDIPANSALTGIGVQAFYECRSLKGIALPAGISRLENETFMYCYSLAKAILPPALESIGGYCFYDTYALNTIDLPQTLDVIETAAFANSGLESVELPQNLKSIGHEVFAGCKSMKSALLPATPNIGHRTGWGYDDGIGYYATFINCTALEKVICLSATPPAILNELGAFSGVDRSQVTLVVPAFSIVDYKLDTYWHEFGTIIGGAEPDVLNIGSTLTLNNNRRPSNKVDVLLAEGAALTVGGNAPFEVGTLTLNVNMPANNFGKLLNNSPAMSADQVTTRFYVEGGRWYFITPLHDVNIGDASHDDAEASFVFRYYNGQNRAANGAQGSWQDLTDNTLHAGQGYILQANRNGWMTLPATAAGKSAVMTSDDASAPLTPYTAVNAADADWNFVGNPYPCYYDTYYMEMAAPITVWDYNNWTYRAYSPVDDDYVLRPMEAFFVQKPASLSKIEFPKEGRQMKAEAQRNDETAARRATSSARQLFDIVVTDGTLSDRTRIVVNGKASTAYEPERDAAKFISSTDAPQLYSTDGEGTPMAINERPVERQTAVALTVSTRLPGTFTISLDRGTTGLWLHDSTTGQCVDLSRQSYTFTIAAGTYGQRFTLTLDGSTTGISDRQLSADATKPLFDLQGRRIDSSSTKKGIYLQNGKKVIR